MNRIATILLFLALCLSGAEVHDTWLTSTSGWASEGDLANMLNILLFQPALLMSSANVGKE